MSVVPTWRFTGLATEANPDPLYSGKHRDHGVNVQALATADRGAGLPRRGPPRLGPL